MFVVVCCGCALSVVVCCRCVVVDQTVDQTNMYTPVNNLIENRCAQERAPPERSVASLTGLVTLDLYYLYLCGSIPSIADRSELTETTPQQKQCVHMFQAARSPAGAASV